MQEDLHAVEALRQQQEGLQLLVSELLLENQNLRMTVAKLKQMGSAGVANSPEEAPFATNELPSAAKAVPMLLD